MKIEFKINKYALASEVMSTHGKDPAVFPFFEKAYKKIWDIYSDDPEFFLIQTNYASWGIQMISLRANKKGFVRAFTNSTQYTEKIYQEIFRTTAFKKIERETETYLQKIENQWRKKEPLIKTYIKDVLRIPEIKETVTVYIFHPKLSEGRAYYKDHAILWGHKELWENYSIVYITHEILHILLNGICRNKTITHALIELATDNELRVRLNPQDIYFMKDGVYQGHKYQEKLVKKIYPSWKKFLKETTPFLKFEKKLALVYKREE
ncbi:MAG: hypothetical protein WC099_01690 [Candidatus Paceibacterota bacterium]